MESKQNLSGLARYAKYIIILFCLPAIVIFGGDAVFRIINGAAKFYIGSTLLYLVMALVCILNIVMSFRDFDKIKVKTVFIVNITLVACFVFMLSDHPNAAIMVLIAALPLLPLGIVFRHQKIRIQNL